MRVFQQRVAVAHSKFICCVVLPLCSGTLKDTAWVPDLFAKSEHVFMPLDFASTSLLVHSKLVLNPSTPLVQNTHQHTLALVRMQHLPNRFSPTQWPSGIWQCDTALFRCSNAALRVQPMLSTRAFNALALNPVYSNLAFNLHIIFTW